MLSLIITNFSSCFLVVTEMDFNRLTDWAYLCVSAVLRGDHCNLAETPLGSRCSHPAGLRRSCDLVLQAEGGCDGTAAVAGHLQAARWITSLTVRTEAHWEKPLVLFVFLNLYVSSSSPENVRSLQHLCRLRIRRCLGRLRLRSPVFMSFLPLPGKLKNFILYQEYDLDGWQRTQLWKSQIPFKFIYCLHTT